MLINVKKINRKHFTLENTMIGGKKCYLIKPKKTCIWDEKNNFFNFSIWDEDNKPVSLYFKKEIQTLKYPIPLKKIQIIEKIYGTAIIVNQYKNNLIIRDIRNFNLKNQELKKAIESKYLSFFKYLKSSGEINCSFIFNVINEELYLINIIDHENFKYWKQHQLDTFSIQFKFKRPITFPISDLNKLDPELEVFVFLEKDNFFYKLKIKELNNAK